MTTKDKIMVKSMTRTTMAFLLNIIRRSPSHPMAGRIQGRVDRLRQHLVDVFDDISRKRTAPAEPTDGLSDAKRRRIGAEVPGQTAPGPAGPALPQGQVTYAQLFTLTQDRSLLNFDAKTLPLDLVLRLVPPLLSSIDQTKFNAAINVGPSRHVYLHTDRVDRPDTIARAPGPATNQPCPGCRARDRQCARRRRRRRL